MTLPTRPTLILYFCAAVSVAYVDHAVRKFPQHTMAEYVPSVIAGTSGAPAKYRVLMPYLLDGIARGTGADPASVFLVVEFAAILGALVAVHVLLRVWYGEGPAVAGTLGLAALLPLAFTNSWAHPDTFPDLLLFTAGCWCVAARRDVALYPILLVGMFNRETIGFVAILWAIDRLRTSRDRTTLARAMSYVVLCGVVYLGLRWSRGFEHYRYFMLPENLALLKLLPAGFDPYRRLVGYYWVPLVAAPMVLALIGVRRPAAPRYFGSALIVALLFSAVAWTLAAVAETRVFVPVLPLLAPAVVAAFVPPAVQPVSQPAGTA
jgi:hypothetical protein